MLLASVVLTFPTGSDPSSRQRLPVVATVRTAVVETSDAYGQYVNPRGLHQLHDGAAEEKRAAVGEDGGAREGCRQGGGDVV